MPDVELRRLRGLRSKAQDLLSTLVADLKPFRHNDALSGFRRKPDSESLVDDVNITTTCSCLMGLALAGKLDDFYGEDRNDKVRKTFAKLLSAPWMSSGLTENNAFTTTLVIRLFGFLSEAEILTQSDASAMKKDPWELNIAFSDFPAFLGRLSKREEPFCRFLHDQLTPRVQASIASFLSSGENRKKVEKQVVEELSIAIRTQSFYDEGRFNGVTLSATATTLLAKTLNRYLIAELNRVLLHDFFTTEIQPLRARCLADIASEMAANLDNFKINDYPSAAAVLYWFVDGVARAGMCLSPEDWTRLCGYAVAEFGRQRSLTVARHAAMMDPVAMAMSACLCARLRTISNELTLGMTKDHHALLPSMVELKRAIVDLFGDQTASGIWPKYFPLFHYQDAGSNFCFTFELLEAILVEFGRAQDHLLVEESVVSGLERAITWCGANRLSSAESASAGSISYNGWNSGGYLETLRKGQPESWPTAVVHMFLFELVEVLSSHIQARLVKRYNASRHAKKLESLLDIDILIDGGKGLRDVLSTTVVATFQQFKGFDAEKLRKAPREKQPLSALLFGPPGTSKTEVAKAVAAELEWPLVEIDPSNFLQESFQNIYVQAERIFEDVMDMTGVVILFDEMDALVQERHGDTMVDTESKFLTTYMLPKLSKLHGRGQSIFLMATNFQAYFDAAIKRAGRFDLLLCMGPPKFEEKCRAIHVFLGTKSNDQTRSAGEAIKAFGQADPWVEDQLTLYTYGEFGSFISGLGDVSSIGDSLQALKADEFKKKVEADSRSVGLKLADLNPLKAAGIRFTRLSELDTVELKPSFLKDKNIDLNVPIIKYLLDRRESRRQYPSTTKTH